MSVPAVIPDRMRQRMKDLGITQASLARRLGISQATVARLTLGLSEGSKFLHAIARELTTTGAYLTGETDYPGLGSAEPVPLSSLAEQLKVDRLPLFDFRYGIGEGTTLDRRITSKFVMISRELFQPYTQASSAEIFLGTGIGDAMAPTLSPRDWFICDRSQTTPATSDLIWVVQHGGEDIVRRIRCEGEGFTLHCDNPNLAEMALRRVDVEVIARVVGVLRRL